MNIMKNACPFVNTMSVALLLLHWQVWCCQSGENTTVFQLDRSPTAIATPPKWASSDAGVVCVGDDDGVVHMLKYMAAAKE